MNMFSLRQAHRLLSERHQWRPQDEKLPDEGPDVSQPPIDDETTWEDEEGDVSEKTAS